MTATKNPMPVRALAPWFGAGRMIAERVGKELEGCTWVGIPFAGGMSEVAAISARSIAVNDLHCLIINLARCVADDELRRVLVRELSRSPFHPKILKEAQENCRNTALDGDEPYVPAAIDYFIACWMGRSHKAGCRNEFNGCISTRWNANGGDSNARYRSAIRGLVEWGRVMRRCSFQCMDAFDFLARCPDTSETGIYVDAPWPDDGANYRHKFSEDDQRRLAQRLAEFRRARVVIRFGDHPLIRQLYPDGCSACYGRCSDATYDCAHCFNKNQSSWRWFNHNGRTQTHEAKREVLIINGPSRAEGRLFA